MAFVIGNTEKGLNHDFLRIIGLHDYQIGGFYQGKPLIMHSFRVLVAQILNCVALAEFTR